MSNPQAASAPSPSDNAPGYTAAAARPAGGRLPTWRLAAYGLLALPVALLGVPVFVYLPKYLVSPEIGLAPAAVALVLGLARIWDMVTDPLIGVVSDRTRSRFGRRRPWILAGVPPTVLGAWMLFLPAPGVGAVELLVWAMLATLGATMLLVPYSAWGAELSADYHDRIRITAWREGFAIVGTLVSLVLPALVATPTAQADGGIDLREALYLILLTLIVTLPVGLAALAFVAEPKLSPTAASADAGRPAIDWRGLKTAWRNPPFRILIFSYLLNGMANGLPASLFLLYVSNVLEAGDQAGALLLTYFAAGIASIPLWLWLAKRWGKHVAWCRAMLWASAVFALVPFLGAGDTVWFFLICIGTGAALGADLALPVGMQADVIDLDRLRSGQQRAGLFFALWGMATKLALAAALVLAFPLLDVVGFVDGPSNAPDSLFVLAVLYAWVPVAFKLAAVWLMRRYPIDAARQARLRARIARRFPSDAEASS